MKISKKSKIELDDIGFIGSQQKISISEQKKIDKATSNFIRISKTKTPGKIVLVER